MSSVKGLGRWMNNRTSKTMFPVRASWPVNGQSFVKQIVNIVPKASILGNCKRILCIIRSPTPLRKTRDVKTMSGMPERR